MRGKQHGIMSINVVNIKFCQILAANLSIGGPLLHKRPPKDYLAAKSCPGFVVEFNIYNFYVDDSMSFTLLLHGSPQL